MNRDPIDRFEGGNHFLSNYHEVPGGFHFEGIRWPTSEHTFNGLKTFDPKDRGVGRSRREALQDYPGSPRP